MPPSHWIHKACAFLVLILYSASLAFSLSTARELSSPVEKRSDVTAPSSALVAAFQNSLWIWSQEPNNPPIAPIGNVAFRKILPTPPSKVPTSVNIMITVDNWFELYVDGLFVGESPQTDLIWENAQYYTVPLDSSLSTHVLAVLGTNLPDGNGQPNPAAVLAAIEIEFSDGSTTIITADSSWIYTKTIPSNWFALSLDTSTWLSSEIVDPYGSGPWGNLVTIPTDYTASGLTFDNSFWIWSAQPNPPNAPPGQNAFRKTFTAPPGKFLQSASILITTDNYFILYVNGTLIGAPPNQTFIWESPQQFPTPLAVPLSGTTTVFAVNATNFPDVFNGGDNPAGVLAMIIVHFTDGSSQTIVSDTTWKVLQSVPAGFQSMTFNDSSWPTAVSQGPYGVSPWGFLLPE